MLKSILIRMSLMHKTAVDPPYSQVKRAVGGFLDPAFDTLIGDCGAAEGSGLKAC
jgi:hypothetical protein